MIHIEFAAEFKKDLRRLSRKYRRIRSDLLDRPHFCRQSVAALRVAPLKLYRGQTAGGTMPADRVVKHLDVIEDI